MKGHKMNIVDLLKYDSHLELMRDAEFDTFAHCVVKLNKKVITFADSKDYIEIINNNKSIAAVICKEEFVDKISNRLGILVSDEPRYDFFKIYNLFMKDNNKLHKKSRIGQGLNIGSNVSISDYGVIIGKNVTIGDNVVVKENTVIGDNVVILSGCVIGEEGFEVKRKSDKTLYSVKHYGKTVIEDNTIIKSLVSIHRAVFEWDSTSIGSNCVIDSMTHVAHGAKIRNRILIGSNSSLCGNCEIMDNAYLGPNVCICNRIRVGKDAKVSIGSVVTKNVPDGTEVTGNFAINHEKWIKFIKQISK